MSDEPKKAAPHPLVTIVGSCVGSSVGIAAIAFFLRRNLTDSGMWAVAAMAALIMGCVIAHFLTSRHS